MNKFIWDVTVTFKVHHPVCFQATCLTFTVYNDTTGEELGVRSRYPVSLTDGQCELPCQSVDGWNICPSCGIFPEFGDECNSGKHRFIC